MPENTVTEGQPGRALCRHCRAVMTLTYRYRSVALDDDEQAVATVLAGVCNVCQQIVALPPQSTPDLKRAKLAARHTVAALLPQAVLDTLDQAGAIVAPDALPDFPKRLLLHYVHEFATGQRDLRRLDRARHVALAQFAKAGQQPLKRYTVFLSADMAQDFARTLAATWLNTTMLLKCLAAEIQSDIIDAPTPERLAALRAWSAGRHAGPHPAPPRLRRPAA